MAEYRNIKLGLFFITGTALLILALYFIGSKQNLFGSTFRISAQFYNVNGLMKGNNVRFAGINVGTVESVEIVTDSSVSVTMVIENRVRKFIKKNAVASVGTEGLMGNKLVNINSGGDHSPSVEDGDVLETKRPVEMDQVVSTLNVTNENIKVITTNLRHITDKINAKNSFWSLLMDTVVAENIKTAVVSLKLMGNEGVMVTGNLREITDKIKQGKGSVGALITDTVISSKIRQSVIKFERISDSTAVISGNVAQIVKKLKEGKGTIGVLLNDTMLIHNLNKSVATIDKGAGNFSEDMEALKHTWPFKKYFRKKAKNKIKKP